MTSPERSTLVLVTGATGYIGGRLVPRLLAQGFRVRVLVRTPAKLEAVPWKDDVEVVTGDLSSLEDTTVACEGVHTFYYLVHSMGSGASFEETEQGTARLVADAAAAAGVNRVVYIGGLVQIPCIERNTMGAIKAITASQLALQSNPDKAKVSLDAVVNTMWETALDMNSKYKETSDGGLATNIPISLPEC